MHRDALLHPATLLSATALGIDPRWLAGTGVEAATLHHGGALVVMTMGVIAFGTGRLVAVLAVGTAYTLLVGCPMVTELANVLATQLALPMIPAAAPVALLALVLPATLGPRAPVEELTLARIDA